ncbi:MAG: leucine-rich repeat protein [Bacteroidales bacterium]|nr:leucine-rich repeat protein [Bacteroidales bacterium]
MKKLLLILALALLAVCQSAFAYDFSAVAPSGHRLYYNIVNGEAQVTYQRTSSPHYYNLTGDLSIPSSVTNPNNGQTYAVTSIGGMAFYGCSGLTSVTIPNAVTSIGYDAFYGCSGLTSVTIPNSVTSIGYDAFSGCSGLTSVIIPNSVTSIGMYAFYDCSGLTSITIPDSVTSIGEMAFSSCSGLTSVNFNAINCTSMGSSAYPVFQSCTNLNTVTIGNNVQTIPAYAFTGCSGLTSVIIPNSVTSIGIYAFYDCSGLTSVTIPNSVTSIGGMAFLNCSGLTSVTIPNSVTSIGNYAFSDCCGLTSALIPDGVTSIGRGSFRNCSGLTSITIPNSVISIGEDSFMDCTGLISVAFNADSCTYAGTFDYGPFHGCTNITSFTLGDNVKVIPSYLCRDLTSLYNITIPGSVTWIDAYAFYSCSGLTSVTIPNSVTSIDWYAFGNCNSLDTVYMMPLEAPTLGSSVFFHNASDRVFILNGCSYDNYYNNSSWNSYRTYLCDPIINISLNVLANDSTFGTANVVPGRSNRDIRCDSTTVIEATANYGYHFDHWSNNKTTNPDTLKLTNDTSITAIFAKNQYSVVGSPNDGTKGSVDGSDTVDYLDSVTLTAQAYYGYHFLCWSDNDTNNPRTVVANENINLTAIFEYNRYTINANADTSIHGYCTGGGSYNYLSSRTIQANAYYGYHFTQWNDGVNTNPRTITLTQDTQFVAMYAKNQYSVTGTTNDSVMGVVFGSETVEYLDSVTLTATANYGYHFLRWNDYNTENPRKVAATENISLTAIFDYNQYTLTLLADTSIHGTVSGDGSFSYLYECTINATANYGYHFTQWDDGDTNNPRVITLTQDTSFTAHFAPNQYTLIVTAGEHGATTGSGTYDYGDTVTIQAVPEPHYHFTRWNDGITDNPRQFRVEGDRTLTAFFAIDTHTVNVVPSDPVRGMVTQSGTEFVYLTPCTVEAIPYSGYTFAGWSDGSTYNPYTFAVTEDVELTAVFLAEGEVGIENINANDFNVYSYEGRIVVEGAGEERVSVFDMVGREVRNEALPAGVYLVKVGTLPARKVAVVR